MIVPVLNDQQGLQTTLLTLLHQTYPRRDYQVIVVDNGSTDDTHLVGLRFAEADPDLFRVVEERDIRTSYGARNRGVRISSGDLLCFLDANMTVSPDYLERVAERFDRDDVDYLGCAVELQADRDTMAGQYDRAFGFIVEDYLSELGFAPTCCLSVRRRVLEQVGLFDDRLESSGDLEFGQRVRDAGFLQAYAGDIVLRHPVRADYRSLVTKARRLARGAAQLTHYHPARYGENQRRYSALRSLLPQRAAMIATRYAAIGRPLSAPAALGISVWALPLKWIRRQEFFRELERLRSSNVPRALR